MKLIKWILSLFKSAPKTEPKQNQPVIPNDPIPNVKKLLTREEYNQLNDLIFEAKVKVPPYTDYPYFTLRETNGNNRSKGIDALITRQGGSLGDAYCQFGQQDKMDAVALHLGIPRKMFNYPEGGGTQRVFNAVDPKYKTDTPKAACFVTVEYNNSGKGHIEDVREVVKISGDGHTVKTRAFNTTIDGDDSIARDGAGAGFATRTIKKEWVQGKDTVRLRGYVDHYAIYVDAFKKFYNV